MKKAKPAKKSKKLGAKKIEATKPLNRFNA
jgi:hypothetical protein